MLNFSLIDVKIDSSANDFGGRETVKNTTSLIGLIAGCSAQRNLSTLFVHNFSIECFGLINLYALYWDGWKLETAELKQWLASVGKSFSSSAFGTGQIWCDGFGIDLRGVRKRHTIYDSSFVPKFVSAVVCAGKVSIILRVTKLPG